MATLPNEVKERVTSYISHQAAKTPDAIRGIVQQGHDQLLGVLDGISEEQARFKPGADEWSILEVMRHAVSAQRSVVRVCDALAGGEAPERREEEGGSVETLEEARVAFQSGFEELVAFVVSLSADSNVEARSEHPFFGPLNCREWAVFQRIHDVDHAQQIDQVKASSGFPA